MSGRSEGLFVGLMSGTSLDGVDAALVAFTGTDERPSSARLEAFATQPYDAALRERLGRAVRGQSGADAVCDLGFDLGSRFADAAEDLLAGAGVAPDDVVAIGSHGQTIWHRPPERGEKGATLQIGESAVIAERLGVPVIADFRVRDVAAAGHGAPITPYFDLMLLSSPELSRAIQNIGGMANVTALPREGSEERPLAFDTGPGVALVDAAIERLTDGAVRYDLDGGMAAAGQVLPSALDVWLADEFFRQEPPRSTGRERFGGARLEEWLEANRDERAADLMATLTELTARSIAEAHRWIDFEIGEVLLSGGGARNPEIRRRVASHLDASVRVLDEVGWSADAREATAFALLARQHVLGIPIDLTWATGAAAPRILGKETPA
jgi:anhydro-N-acetylmuramic acid kinase